MFFNLSDSTRKLLAAIIYFVMLLSIVAGSYMVIQKFKGFNQNATVRGQQEVVISDLTASNEQLRVAIDNKAKADGITQGIVQDAIVAKQISAESIQTQHTQVEKKVTELKKAFNVKISQTTDPQVSVQLIKEKEDAVSNTRITALWANYCKNETNQPECKELFL